MARLAILPLLLIIMVRVSFAEDGNHSGSKRSWFGSGSNSRGSRATEQVSANELGIVPNMFFKTQSQVSVEVGRHGDKKAMWLHRGPMGRVEDKLNLFFVKGAKVKNLKDAQEICGKMIPPGKWRLPAPEEIVILMVIGNPENMLDPVPVEDKNSSYNFWSSSEKGESSQDKDGFKTLGGGQKFENQTRSFHKMINKLRQDIDATQDPKEKARLQAVFDQVKDGIPALCIAGKTGAPWEE